MMRGLPPGFRFEPTEEELVFEYLKCKVFSSALPASIIPEINGVWSLDPWDIPAAGGGDEEKYLFSKEAEEHNNNNNGEGGGIIGWSKSGYWKARGREKEIVSNENGVALMGMKNTLDFYTNNIRKMKKTGWVMHQYRLIIPHSHSSTNKWVLCHILSPTNKLFSHIVHPHRHRRRLHCSISSTKDVNGDHEDEHDEHVNHITTSTAFSDDEHDSVSSTASSSSTSATFTDFTSTATTTTFHF
ncbi:NAC domain-containing protein 83 isoform X2 [Cucumis sativus]|nr:NAC domain-containing protein 83 isoform X2 [Cucumis sativus]KAE8652374.1 hypothetical protein Csa_014231 [Cucumis sativus]